ncbi:MAG: quinone oxidoreductase [Kiloniellales bacterium]
MTHAIRIHETGGPEVLRWEEVEVGDPGPGEIRVKHTACGLNFIDTYQRSGAYPLALPATLGMEAAGLVEAVGDGVAEFKPGDRVAYGFGPPGAYVEARVMPAHRVVRLPDGVDDQQGAAMMLKGMTVRYLVRRTYQVQPGDTVLFHAAAGGVGLIACQWLKHLGATVIGTVGTDAKAELAKAHGCDYPIVYTREDFVARVKEITDGQGLPVVYDAVGKDTVMKSLDCLAPFGLLVTFGNASGPVPPINPLDLAQRGSLYLTRPTLQAHVAKREDLLASANELFDVVLKGVVKIEVDQTYPLQETAQAHRDLEGRKTTGCSVLLP